MYCERLIASGMVQGVGFRFWAVREARRLGLEGWVRNLPDGTVELVAAGDRAKVEEMASLCRRGPSSARVSDLSRQPCQPPTPAGSGFRVRH